MTACARRLLLGAAFSILSTAGANAADPMVELPVASFNWTGFYIGIGGGAGAAVHGLSSPVFLGGVDFDGIGGEGVFGELTVGYDYMFSNRFLVGAFVDGRLGNISTTLDTPGPVAELDLPYGFDVALRAGYLVTPDTLAYVLGGYSWQQFDLSSNVGLNADWDRSGYVLGVGLETVVMGNWTLKGEYRFAQYGTQGFFPIPGGPNGLEVDSSTHTFHVGANYRFGATAGGGVAFESPLYNWTGFYVGAALGAGAVVHELSSPIIGAGSFNGIGGEGIFGEVMVGYDHEFANGFVAGVMADGRYSGLSTTLDAGGGAFSADLDADYGFDLLARAGYKFTGSTLAYVLAGYSWQHFDLSANPGGGIVDWDAHGFSVGGGLEAAMTERATVGLEYRYSHYGSDDLGTGGLIEVDPSAHTVRATFKYKLF